MQLTPWYGADPILSFDGDPGAIGEPVIRQRRRLAEVLSGFDDEQWAHPSRCEAWSNRDVITHLQTTNQFWSFSIALGLKGEPTQFLATFDPVASPAQLVADAPGTTNAELLEQFTASNEALAHQLEALDDAGWTTLAESPVGHVSIGTLAHQALWDALIHERDVLLPLEIEPAEEPDETLASLRFAAAIGSAYAASRHEAAPAVITIDATDHDAPFTVEVTDRVEVRDGRADGAFVLTGRGIDLMEALSLRIPPAELIPAEAAWMVDTLKVTFDQAG